MLVTTLILRKRMPEKPSTQLLAGFQPFKRRPLGLYSKAVPDFYTPHSKATRDPSDPSRSTPLTHTIIKVCRTCRRSLLVPLSEKYHFHTCCTNEEMAVQGSMKHAFSLPEKIQRKMRVWDVVNEKPFCNPHMPRPKGRSHHK